MGAKIGSQTVYCLIDSGANVCIMSKTLFYSLSPHSYTKLPITQPNVYGIGNNRIPVYANISVYLNLGPVRVKQKFLILDTHVPILLGIDFLRGNRATLDYADSSITVLSHKFSLKPPPVRQTKVSTLNCEDIPAFSARNVRVCLERPPITGQMLIKASPAFRRKCPGASIANGIIDSQVTYCRVVNDTDRPLFIPRNAPIALACTQPFPTIKTIPDFCKQTSVPPTVHFATARNNIIGDTSHRDPFNDLPNLSTHKRKFTKSDFSINTSDISQQEVQNLQKLLVDNSDIFSSGLSDLGFCQKYEMEIDTGQNKPVLSRFYRTTPALQDVIDSQVDDLLKYGIIEPSLSCWASPCVLVKKTGKDPVTNKQRYRLVQDYRSVNSLTSDISHPIPKFDDLLYDIGSKQPRYFTKLDMNHAFHQFPITKSDRPKSAFVTKHGHYQYKRVAFGLKSSPIFFTSAMTKILQKFIRKKQLFIYADDLIIFSRNIHQHMNILKKVFQTFRENNLTLDPSKCKFAETQVKYLGFILNEKGLSADPEKINAVQSFPAPKTVKHVQRFLGLTNFYRRYIKKLLKNCSSNEKNFEKR